VNKVDGESTHAFTCAALDLNIAVRKMEHAEHPQETEARFMAQRHHDIRTLNRLMSHTLDSAKIYRKAMGDVRSADLTLRFRIRCRERMEAYASLREQVDAIGGDPQDDGTVLAPLRRVMVNLYCALHDGDWAVVQEVDRQEQKLKKKYDAALEDQQLSLSAREAVLRAYESVRAGRVELAKLKRTYREGHS
jgi:uncharacterized protein (TIGR02284 family)